MARVRKGLWSVALAVGLSQLCLSCCAPSTFVIFAQQVRGQCEMVIDYEGTALGIYVTGLETRFPRGNDEFRGRIYWGLDTTSFPNAIPAPVVYGRSDFSKAKDTQDGGNGVDTVDKLGLPYPFPLVGAESLSNDARGPSGITLDSSVDLTDPNDPGIPIAWLSEGMEPDQDPALFSQCHQLREDGQCPRVFKVGLVMFAGTTEIALTDFHCPVQGINFGGVLSPHRG